MRFLAAIFFFVWVASAQAACPAGSIQNAGSALKQARARLTSIHLSEMDESVGPIAQARIEQVKDRLRSFVDAAMACAPINIDVGSLQNELEIHGDAVVERTYDHDGHGQELIYKVAAVTDHPELIGITATLGIECGNDTILMLYQRQAAGWREVMVRRSAPYNQISGAWLNFRYAVSPPDPNGHWFVVTSAIPPWCTSVWRGIIYDLSRPGPTADQPLIVFNKSEGAYIGNDDSGSLKAEVDAFEIRHDTGSIDFDVFTRRVVRRYLVQGDKVKRVPPVAMNARDFVDDWINSPWNEVESWSDASTYPAHKLLAVLNKNNGSSENSFISLRQCGSDRQQVELNMGKTGRPWFFGVAHGRDFKLLSASHIADPICKGSNLLDAIAKH